MATDRKNRTKEFYESRRGFNETVKQIEKEGFGGRVSPTGYTDCMMGMDDLDKLRRIQLNRMVNGKD